MCVCMCIHGHVLVFMCMCIIIYMSRDMYAVHCHFPLLFLSSFRYTCMSLQVIMNVHVACTLMCTLQIMIIITSPTLTFPFGVCVCR